MATVKTRMRQIVATGNRVIRNCGFVENTKAKKCTPLDIQHGVLYMFVMCVDVGVLAGSAGRDVSAAFIHHPKDHTCILACFAMSKRGRFRMKMRSLDRQRIEMPVRR